MLIREATINDAGAICLINKNELGYDYPEDKTKIQLERILSKEGYKIFVCEIDQAVVGYIHAGDYECSYADSLKNILALAVDNNYRRRGIGRELIKAVEDWAKITGAAGIRLVSGSNRIEAHQFYQSCGYIIRKENKNFIHIL